jgi:hypothetical protein
MLLQDVLPAFAVEPGCELVGQVLTAAFCNFDRLIQQSCFAVAESWASTAWNDDANRSCAALLYLMVLQTTSSKLLKCGTHTQAAAKARRRIVIHLAAKLSCEDHTSWGPRSVLTCDAPEIHSMRKMFAFHKPPNDTPEHPECNELPNRFFSLHFGMSLRASLDPLQHLESAVGCKPCPKPLSSPIYWSARGPIKPSLCSIRFFLKHRILSKFFHGSLMFPLPIKNHY